MDIVEKVVRAIAKYVEWDELDLAARAAIEVYEAALKEKGLVIVPREPTEGMKRVGKRKFHTHAGTNLETGMWRVMIDAAPKGNTETT